MTTSGWILGISLILNFWVSIGTKNWYAASAWLVCILEWTRRFN